MSEPETSSEAPVAPAETVSAPPQAVPSTAKENTAFPAPSFGNGRGSGLARGKRGSLPATATSKSAPEGSYKPTAIQVVTAEREYKNPFAPEQPAAPVPPTAPVSPAVAELPISAPISSTPAPTPIAAETRSPVSPLTPATAPAPAGAASALPEEKAELNILPPEDRPRPAQSWESSSFSGQNQSTENRPQGRRDDRPTFRVERREDRSNENRPKEPAVGDGQPFEGRSNEPRREDRGNFRRDARPGEPRGERRDFREGRGGENRDGRGGREQRDNRDGQFRREPRSFEPRPAPTPTPPPAAPSEPKQGGFFGWLKGLFSEDKPAAEKPVESTPSAQEGRRSDGGHRPRHNRGGRGDFRGQNRGEYRGGGGGGGGGSSRGEARGPSEGGQAPGENAGEFNGGERRFEGGGGGGQRRRRHRGGRGRGGFQGDNRGGSGSGENRPDNGGGAPDV